MTDLSCPPVSGHINEYANSMFRHEAMPEAWLAQCTAYVQKLFGTSLVGKTVVDYAFGRGNWSVAFLRAGAAKVIALDAAPDNVARFSAYCKEQGLSGIDVRHGNVLEADIPGIQADLIWAYGILHHLPQPGAFLDAIRPWLLPQGHLYVYAYNAPSLRSLLVNTARSVTVFHQEAAFTQVAPSLIRPARMRLRDDWVAPVVDFYTWPQLTQLLEAHGFYPTRSADMDFQEFLTGHAPWDFYPHQVLCGLAPQANPEAPQPRPACPISEELQHLETLLAPLFQDALPQSVQINRVIGLMNTYYAHVGLSMDQTLLELLLYCVWAHRDDPHASQNPTVQDWLALVAASIQDLPRAAFRDRLGHNRLTDALISGRIRI